MTQQLLIVGASARAAVQSARRSGHLPVAIDLFADADLQAVARTVRIASFRRDLPLAFQEFSNSPWMYAGGLENHPRLVDRLAAERPLLGNSGAVLRRVRNPWQLREAVEAAGLRFPPIEKASAWKGRAGGWIAKPLRSGGGRGIRVLSAEDSQLPRGYYAQQWIEGRSCSAAYVAMGGKAVWLGATRQLTANEPDSLAGAVLRRLEPFAYVGSIGPLVIGETLREPLERLGDALASRFGLVGLFGVDFVLNGAGIWVLEVNPRYTASMEVLEQAFGLAVIPLHVTACLEGRLPAAASAPDFRLGRFCGKAIVYAERECVVGDVVERLIRRWRRSAKWPRVADIPAVGTKLHGGEPVLTVFAAAASPEAVRRRMRWRCERVLRSLSPIT